MDHNYSAGSSVVINGHVQSLKMDKNSAISNVNVPPSTSKGSQFSVLMPDNENVEIQIRNILCHYLLPMHIDLRLVAIQNVNVDYDRARGVLLKDLRNPLCTAKIYNSGKVVIYRCKSEEECKRAARYVGRMVQRSMNKLNQRVCMRNYRVSNILATSRMPFGVRIEELARKYRGEGAKYEPELMVGLEWRLIEPKGTLRIHTTGSVTITGATSETSLAECLKKVYLYLKEFSCERPTKIVKTRVAVGVGSDEEDYSTNSDSDACEEYEDKRRTVDKKQLRPLARRAPRRPRAEENIAQPNGGCTRYPAEAKRARKNEEGRNDQFVQSGIYRGQLYCSDEEGAYGHGEAYAGDDGSAEDDEDGDLVDVE